MKKFILMRQELLEETCPVATQDIHVNVVNRQHAIDEYNYGPANPAEPEDYWQKSADIWGIEVDTAKTIRCVSVFLLVLKGNMILTRWQRLKNQI